MPINPLKDFFKRKKAEMKFARAGPGHTLGQPGQSSQPSTSSQDMPARQAAAEAAMKRDHPNIVQVKDGVTQRDVQIFSTNELLERIKQPDIDDDFFRLTVEDAKLFQQRCNEERERNEILRTSEMRRRELEAKRPTTNNARLRFKLPNDQIIEASFAGTETLNSVKDWLIGVCLEKFQLELKQFDILMGLRPINPNEWSKNLKQLGFIPATTLTVISKS